MQAKDTVRADTLRLLAQRAESLAARMEHVAVAMWQEANGEIPWTNAELALNLLLLDVKGFTEAARPYLVRRAG